MPRHKEEDIVAALAAIVDAMHMVPHGRCMRPTHDDLDYIPDLSGMAASFDAQLFANIVWGWNGYGYLERLEHTMTPYAAARAYLVETCRTEDHEYRSRR